MSDGLPDRTRPIVGNRNRELILSLHKFEELAADRGKPAQAHGVRTTIVHRPLHPRRDGNDASPHLRAEETFHRLDRRFSLTQQSRQLLHRRLLEPDFLARHKQRTTGEKGKSQHNQQ